jgi:FecR protein
VEPADQSSVRIRPEDKTFLWLCMAAWALSFFLPAYEKSNNLLMKSGLGIEAFLYSLIAFYFRSPTYGLLWPVNVLVALAPAFARRLEKGKGRVYVLLLCAWSVYPLLIPLNQFLGSRPDVDRLEIGYYLWQISLLGTATWFLWVIFQRPAIVAGSALFTASLLLVPPIVADHQAHLQFLNGMHVAIGEAEKAMAGYEQTGKPVRVSSRQVKGTSEEDDLGSRDFDTAVVYLNDIYDCQQHERVSDSKMFEHYPGVPVHPPDQAPQSQAVQDSGQHDESAEEWMSCRNVQAAALKRAKLHLSNAKIEFGMMSGKRQVPELLSSFEQAPGVNEFPQKEMPARFRHVRGRVINSGPHYFDHTGDITAEDNLVVQKGDDVLTAAESSASILFADGTSYSMSRDTMLSVDENSVNQAGRTISKVELRSGLVNVETGPMTWRSSSQIDLGSAIVTMGPASAVEVCGSSENDLHTVLLTKGSAEFRMPTARESINLVEHKKIRFNLEGQMQQAQETEPPPSWFQTNDRYFQCK